MQEEPETSIEDFGGEPLEGSGFKNEKPEDGFTFALTIIKPVERLGSDYKSTKVR